MKSAAIGFGIGALVGFLAPEKTSENKIYSAGVVGAGAGVGLAQYFDKDLLETAAGTKGEADLHKELDGIHAEFMN